MKKHFAYISCTLLVIMLSNLPGMALAESGRNQAPAPSRLVIQADRMTEEESRVFSLEHPEIELSYIHKRITSEEMTKMLTAKDDSVDIFEVCVDYAYSTMVKKGFAADLSASRNLRDEVAAMDPTVASALLDAQGHIVAYPTQLRFWSSGIHKGYWQMIFGDRPLPTNMDELMDAWIAFESEHADDYPDIEFSLGFDYAQYCQKLVGFFVRQHDAHGRQPDLQDPALRSALDKLRQVYEIRTAAGRSTEDSGEADRDGVAGLVRFRAWDEAMNEQSNLAVMTSDWVMYDLYMGDFSQMPLSFATDDAPQTDGTMFVYIVNPFSRNMDAAIRYVECASRLEREPYIYYAIHPACNAPVEKPDFQQMIADVVKSKAEQEAILKRAENPHSPEMKDAQAWLDYDNRYLENQEKERWLISAETIAKHHALLKNLNLHTDSIYLGAPGSAAEQMIAELCVRYTEDNLTLDAFLDALGSKMRMMQQENN